MVEGMTRQGAQRAQSAFPQRPTDDRAWVHRFGWTERFAHWWTVLMVGIALLTGLSLGDESESSPLLTVHWLSVVLLGAGLLAALIVGNTRALLRATFHLFRFDRRDARWVRDHLSHPVARGRSGEYGMFNPGQKALAWSMVVAIAAVIYTGVQALSAGDDGSGGPHTIAVIAAMALVGVHIFMAVLNPSTNSSLTGMLIGRVRRSWAARHHGGWLSDVER